MLRPVLALAVVLGLSFAPAAARAGDVLDEAQVEFDKAMEFKMADKSCKKAMPHFERAWTLRKSYELAANMGDCEVQLSKFAAAAEHLRYAVQNISVVATPNDRKNVQAVFDRAREKVAALKITTNAADVVVTVNGTVVGRSPFSQEVFVDPGAAVVRGTHEGYEAAEEKLPDLRAGGSADVKLVLKEIPKPGPVAPRPPPRKDPTAGIALLAVGVVVIAAGVGMQIGGSVLAGQASDKASPGLCVDETSQGCRDFRSTASSQRALMTTSVVAYVAGAGLAGAGIIVLALPGPRRERAALSPWVSPGGAGAVLSGGF